MLIGSVRGALRPEVKYGAKYAGNSALEKEETNNICDGAKKLCIIVSRLTMSRFLPHALHADIGFGQ